MTQSENASFIMNLLSLVERRDLEELFASYHPDVEFQWPPGLPYSGVFTGAAVAEISERFAAIWTPLQPDERTRRMDPRVIATGDGGRVVVHYMWRGIDRSGHRFATETLGDYTVRDGKLCRAQMFYYDLVGLISFLNKAGVASSRAA
jgi:ketosteroid isomerase-like protein